MQAPSEETGLRPAICASQLDSIDLKEPAGPAALARRQVQNPLALSALWSSVGWWKAHISVSEVRRHRPSAPRSSTEATAAAAAASPHQLRETHHGHQPAGRRLRQRAVREPEACHARAQASAGVQRSRKGVVCTLLQCAPIVLTLTTSAASTFPHAAGT